MTPRSKANVGDPPAGGVVTTISGTVSLWSVQDWFAHSHVYRPTEVELEVWSKTSIEGKVHNEIKSERIVELLGGVTLAQVV